MLRTFEVPPVSKKEPRGTYVRLPELEIGGVLEAAMKMILLVTLYSAIVMAAEWPGILKTVRFLKVRMMFLVPPPRPVNANA